MTSSSVRSRVGTNERKIRTSSSGLSVTSRQRMREPSGRDISPTYVIVRVEGSHSPFLITRPRRIGSTEVPQPVESARDESDEPGRGRQRGGSNEGALYPESDLDGARARRVQEKHRLVDRHAE